jgi:hypothetical protein
MKKLVFSSLFLLLAGSLFAQPQHREGPPKPPPIAERWKHDSTKLQLYVGLNPGQISSTKNVFVNFYKDMDALMQNRKDGPPKKEDMDKVVNKRKEALKAIFSAQQLGRLETFRREFMPPPPRKHKPKDGVSPEKV